MALLASGLEYRQTTIKVESNYKFKMSDDESDDDFEFPEGSWNLSPQDLSDTRLAKAAQEGRVGVYDESARTSINA